MRTTIFLVSFLLGLSVQAQSFGLVDTVKIIENNVQLLSPNGGGMNLPVFSPVDLDGDGTMDMVAFDRAGNTVMPFLNGGTTGSIDYVYAPQYRQDFPAGMEDFILMRDYDCDGKMDIFTAKHDGLRVFRNVSTGGNLAFQMVVDTLESDYGAGLTRLYVPSSDVPAIEDIDGDGDLDILTFDAAGTFVEWHKNTSMETAGNCNNLDFVLADACWGKFSESGLSSDITLNVTCRDAPGIGLEGTQGANVHAGSTLAALDEDGDGDMELLIGDLLYAGLTYVRNGGTPQSAYADSTNDAFPIYDASVNLHIFPAASILDCNNDGKLDMVATPHSENISVNYRSVWYYQNITTDDTVRLSFTDGLFMQGDMIDVGMLSRPVFFDHNGDGLMDLLVGNYSHKTSANNSYSGLTFYENTGTASDPVFELVDRDYMNISQVFTNPAKFGLVPAMGDMDGDGDPDMILGDADGKVHYFQNVAPAGQAANFVLAAGNFMGIDVGQFATPTLGDLNRDGLTDLVIGEGDGTLNLYLNVGTTNQPSFPSNPDSTKWGNVDVEPQCCTGYAVPTLFENPENGKWDLLVGSESGDIFYFKDIESQFGNAFALTSGVFGGIHEGTRSSIAGANLDGSGQLEWVVGNLRGGLAFYRGNGPVTSIKEALDQPGFTLYPNPSEGAFTLDFPAGQSGAVQVRILDMQGRVVDSMESDLQRGRLSWSGNLVSGLYFVELRQNGKLLQVVKWQVSR